MDKIEQLTKDMSALCNYFLLVRDFNHTIQAKNLSVREGRYEDAIKLREVENNLNSLMEYHSSALEDVLNRYSTIKPTNNG